MKIIDKKYQEMAEEIVENIGEDGIRDVVEHGVDAGFSGFIYYNEPSAFYRKYQHVINRMVKDMADELGENPILMVSSFKYLKDSNFMEEIGTCLYGGKLSDDTVYVENSLTWFAVEEICRMLEGE